MPSYSSCGNKAYPFNHGLSPIVDNNGHVVKPGSADYPYWSAENGSLTCPNWKFADESTPAVYWTVLAVYVLIATYLTLLQLKVAYYFFLKRRNENYGNVSDRKHGLCFGLPLTTVFELVNTTIMIVMLSILGVYQELNPIYFFVGVGIGIEFYMLSLGLSCWKLINLGQRILPKSIRGDKVMDNSIFHDVPLLLCYTLLLFCVVIAFVFHFILATGSSDIRYSYYAIFFQGLATQDGAFILARQGYRLIKYMKDSSKSIDGNLATPSDDVASMNHQMALKRQNQIKEVARRMRNRTIIVFIVGSPPAVVGMLSGAGAIPFHWYIILIFSYGCAISSFASLMMFIPRGMSLIPCVPTKVAKESDQPEQNKEGNVSDPTSRGIIHPSRQNQVAVASSPNDADVLTTTTNGQM